MYWLCFFFFFFSSRRRHTRYWRDWSSDVCSSDLGPRGSGVGIRPYECRAGPREPLDVQVVADAVTGPRVVDAVFFGEGLQEAVVVGVLEVQLNDVVVYVLECQGYQDSRSEEHTSE